MISKRKIKERAARKRSDLQQLLLLLKKQKQPLWHRVAELLARPRKKAIAVNLDKLNKLTEPEDVVVVPGKVLGKGRLEHNLTLAAVNFSESARQKLELVKAEMLDIPTLIEKASVAKKVAIKIIT